MTEPREITSHVVNPANDRLRIFVEDEPGSGGAHHRYFVEGFSTASNPSEGQDTDHTNLVLLFQNGPINEVGVNGITHEVLLAVLIDRLRCFEAGPYRSNENAAALTCLESAQHFLKERTQKRMKRGVEGTHKL